MNAQVSFLDGNYTLIHIPLDLYSSLLQPILRVLLPQTQTLKASKGEPEHELEGLNTEGQHGFLNISVTPMECSIVCHSSWAKNVFEPAIKDLPKDLAKSVSISKDTYLVLSVISAGMDAAGRVMELTSPLALAGIPIFFITTYYSDFILVPSKDRQTVVKALLARGFELADNDSNFVSPAASIHSRGSSQNSAPPLTPPPSTIAELQVRTFDLLKKRSVSPYVEADLLLVQCSGRETSQLGGELSHTQRPSLSRQVTGNSHRQTWLDNIDTKLYTAMISALAARPRFISITLAQDDPPSLLVDKSLLGLFGESLVGDTKTNLTPIFLDLESLPLEATGIVCGVAGTLVQDMRTGDSAGLSYLSTARAGAVILSCEQSIRALEILTPKLFKA
ncbi:ACT domain-containing protein [Colletotrichum navitas]|uniref:ACT domain-containing protein n=1 Tax=Colletotrichum navitas TaxID=681940 RepID=A0AAD8QBJ0_9PEZI|nr:ACT domain-containing protein [Colletotrichum navitas]KAK1599580.1 ACT domain-containing protein [Colletotrichum navitas]